MKKMTFSVLGKQILSNTSVLTAYLKEIDPGIYTFPMKPSL